MSQISEQFSEKNRFVVPLEHADYAHASLFLCNWHILRRQLLRQWPLITADELNVAGADCRRIAKLIAHRYGIAPSVVENYLRNFERTLPLL